MPSEAKLHEALQLDFKVKMYIHVGPQETLPNVIKGKTCHNKHVTRDTGIDGLKSLLMLLTCAPTLFTQRRAFHCTGRSTDHGVLPQGLAVNVLLSADSQVSLS